MLFYFLDWFYDFIASYEYRYKGISYFFPTGSLNFYPNNLAFFRQKSFVVQNSFFDKTRELFLSLDYKINEIALLYEMYKSEIVLAQEVRNIIQKVSKKQIDYYFLG
ncbi:MAG: hypothetical protein LBH96_04305 [Candidatus Peribacteria bacterium]|nr:hypothetical protein [Candidatus Peribacteria bacterium]